MILVFGGTTEGRKVSSLLDKAGKEFFYSTKRDIQVLDLQNVNHITGGMDVEEMIAFCENNNIKLIVDAAHPFAERLHGTIETVSESLTIPVIRYERKYLDRENDVIWCDDFDGAIDYLNTNNIERLLAFTGLNTINKLKPYWKNNECWVRILDSEISRKQAEQTGFPVDKLLFFSAKDEDELELMNRLKPQVVITKESGESGFYERKLRAAREYGAEIIVIKRPELSDNFENVDNEKELEDKIRELHPTFFKLRKGFTTGACATAATKAALRTLITQVAQKNVNIVLPNSCRVSFKIEKCDYTTNYAFCSVRKYAGDDPDVTNGAIISAKVEFNDLGKIVFTQGEGVGVVTLSGLDIPVGGPAINPVPRAMIKESIKELKYIYEESRGVDVCISVEGGKELAKKTLNSKLGIEGGISIIGTSGIVMPFSRSAFVASIEKEIDVAKSNACEHLVINSGAKSERYLRDRYKELPDYAFVHFGNFIGETLKKVSKVNMKKLTLGIMLGKAVKLAEGHLDTHSKNVLMNKKYLCTIAEECGYGEGKLEKIRLLTMARELTTIFPFVEEEPFYKILADRCMSVCNSVLLDIDLELLLIDRDGNILEFGVLNSVS